MVCTLGFQSICEIADFHDVFKFYAYCVNNSLFLSLTTTRLWRTLPDLATTNVCKVDTSNRNHIERSRWIKWLITRLYIAEETHINFNTLWKWLQRRNMAAAIQPVQLAMLACASRRAQRELKNWPCFDCMARQQRCTSQAEKAGADPGFWAQKVSTCACSAYFGRESLGITSANWQWHEPGGGGGYFHVYAYWVCVI